MATATNTSALVGVRNPPQRYWPVLINMTDKRHQIYTERAVARAGSSDKAVALAGVPENNSQSVATEHPKREPTSVSLETANAERGAECEPWCDAKVETVGAAYACKTIPECRGCVLCGGKLVVDAPSDDSICLTDSVGVAMNATQRAAASAHGHATNLEVYVFWLIILCSGLVMAFLGELLVKPSLFFLGLFVLFFATMTALNALIQAGVSFEDTYCWLPPTIALVLGVIGGLVALWLLSTAIFLLGAVVGLGSSYLVLNLIPVDWAMVGVGPVFLAEGRLVPYWLVLLVVPLITGYVAKKKARQRATTPSSTCGEAHQRLPPPLPPLTGGPAHHGGDGSHGRTGRWPGGPGLVCYRGGRSAALGRGARRWLRRHLWRRRAMVRHPQAVSGKGKGLRVTTSRRVRLVYHVHGTWAPSSALRRRSASAAAAHIHARHRTPHGTFTV